MAPQPRSAADAPFATLIGVTRTYCHPEAYEDAYEALKRLARRKNDPEMALFKEQLRYGLTRPDEVPRSELAGRAVRRRQRGRLPPPAVAARGLTSIGTKSRAKQGLGRCLARPFVRMRLAALSAQVSCQ
jgi:hypothetical protein